MRAVPVVTDDRARIVMAGVADEACTDALQTAVRTALVSGPRVQVDVRDVESWDAGAVRGLAECARLGPGVEFLMRGARRASAAPSA